jgi:hypothetical protein
MVGRSCGHELADGRRCRATPSTMAPSASGTPPNARRMRPRPGAWVDCAGGAAPDRRGLAAAKLLETGELEERLTSLEAALRMNTTGSTRPTADGPGFPEAA